MTIMKHHPFKYALCAITALLMTGQPVLADPSLNSRGFVPEAPRKAPEGLVCEMPRKWASPEVNAAFPRTPLLVGSDAVYTGSGSVYALDINTGEQLWEFKTPDVPYDTVFVNNGINALALDGDTVYFGGYTSILYAIDRHTGKERWRLQLEGRGIGVPISFDKDSVYVGWAGRTAAINKATGEKRWEFRNPDGFGAFAPMLDGKRLLVAGGYTAYALDTQTGNLLWEQRWDDEKNAYDSLSILSSAVYQNQFMAGDGRGVLHAFDARTGEPLWRLDRQGMRARLQAVWGQDGKVLLFGAGNLAALFDSQTQEVLWWFNPTYGKNFMPPYVYKNMVFMGNEGDYLFVLNLQTGEEVFRFPISKEIGAIRAVVVKNDVVYFTSVNGRVYAYNLQCPQLR